MKMDTPEQETNGEAPVKAFGEERERGTIFNVFLKKIYHSRSEPASEGDEDPAAPSSIQWETVKLRTMKAANVQNLVNHLPKALQDRDSLYLNIFLSTYLTFTTPRTVLQLLKESYCQACNSYSDSDLTLKRNIRSVLFTWLDENPLDFCHPPDHPNLRYLQEFATEIMRDDELIGRIEQCSRKLQYEYDESKDYSFMEASIGSEFSVCDAVDFMMQGKLGYRHITEIDTSVLAEQLTYIDAELFRRVNPQHCIGSIWSRRDKKSADVDAFSVRATINQFNDVSNKVISTILWDKSLNPSSRAKIISKWIDVAQACRELKNFSSLKAIFSGLQSHPVHRLKKTWDCIPKQTLQLYDDLAGIFVDDNNFEAWREILMKEGTAKFAPMLLSKNGKWTVRALKRRSFEKFAGKKEAIQCLVYGTIPYLGTFLTDLDMIDKANPDFLEGDLINFEKKRKEFEVIAQIRLLQAASKNYKIESDPEFLEWFRNIIVLSYQEFCGLSDEIERPPALPKSAPPTPSLLARDPSRPKLLRKFFSFTAEDYKNRQLNQEGKKKGSWLNRSTREHGKTNSLSSNSSQETAQSFDDSISIDSGDISMTHSQEEPIPEKALQRKLSNMKPSQSLTCLSKYDDISTSPPTCQYHQPSESCRIIRVALESPDDKNSTQGNVYKSLVITHQERAPAIIQAAIAKHNLPAEVKPQEYALCQIMADGVLCIPNNANVFYAMSTTSEPYFILKKKETDERIPPSRVRSFKKHQDQRRRSLIWFNGGTS